MAMLQPEPLPPMQSLGPSAGPSGGPNGLPKLPLELFYEIYDDLEPCWHFSLAATCKTIYIRSKPILDAHRSAHREFRVTSDLSLTPVVRLYNSAQTSVGLRAIEAWYVRKFEIWGTTATWRSWQIDSASNICVARNEGLMATPLRITEVMRPIQPISATNGPFADYDEFKRGFDVGDEGCLEATVISMLPRLKELIFVEQAPRGLNTLRRLSQMIQWSVHGPIPWPPGFLSLRKVAVGVPVNQLRGHAMAPLLYLYALLNLPGIEDIYYRNLVLDESRDYVLQACPPRPKTSSVKTLILDEMQRDDLWLRETLLNAPMGLETLVIRGHNHALLQFVDLFPGILACSASRDSVRNLLFYRPDRLRGYSNSILEPSDLLQLGNLRMVHLGVEDFLLECYRRYRQGKVRPASGGACPHPSEWEIGPPAISANHEEGVFDDASLPTCVCGRRDIYNPGPIEHGHVVAYLQNRLPRTLEVLILWGHEDKIWYDRKGYEENEALDDAIVEVIGSGSFPNLKAIYLEQVEKHEPIPKTKICFQKTMEVAKHHGVYIRTLSNQYEPISQLGFPIILDRFDLETGPFPARDPTLVFDPFDGAWTSPGCGSCGDCETCLLYYTSEAWADFKKKKLMQGSDFRKQN